MVMAVAQVVGWKFAEIAFLTMASNATTATTAMVMAVILAARQRLLQQFAEIS
jgi:chromate transport protein ChrA